MRPVVNYCLLSVDKADIPAEIHKHRFYNFAINTRITVAYTPTYMLQLHVYGSKAGERVASAIVFKGITKSMQLPDLTSIFHAELYALFLAINVIRWSKLKIFVILSDSLSSLQAIDGFNIDNDLVQKFIKEYSFQTKQGEKKPSLYVGFQVMEVRRPILLQKVAFLSLLLH